MERTKKRNIIIAAVVLVVLIAAFLAVYFLVIEPPVSGEKDITVDIIHADNSEKTIEINTDAEYLRQALEEEELIEGSESSAGFFVTAVDGEAADSEKQEWWNFTQNGEYLMTGVDMTPIEDGDQFEIIFTVGW